MRDRLGSVVRPVTGHVILRMVLRVLAVGHHRRCAHAHLHAVARVAELDVDGEVLGEVLVVFGVRFEVEPACIVLRQISAD